MLTIITILALLFLAIFLTGEWLYRRGVPAEYTRKGIHVASGLLALTFPVLLGSVWAVMVLCALFLLLLFASKRLELLGSIHAIPRRSAGAVFFPVAVAVCFALAAWRAEWRFFYLPVAFLTVSDTVACLVGRRWTFGRYTLGFGYKSLGGSLAFLASAIGICVLVQPFAPVSAPAALAAATAAMLGEAAAGQGWDNLSVPLATAGALALV